MSLFPLVLALGFILIAALILRFWPSMDPSLKNMFIAVVGIAVLICLVAVVWPLFGGHGMTVPMNR